LEKPHPSYPTLLITLALLFLLSTPNGYCYWKKDSFMLVLRSRFFRPHSRIKNAAERWGNVRGKQERALQETAFWNEAAFCRPGVPTLAHSDFRS
jgi:hypothetical protein